MDYTGYRHLNDKTPAQLRSIAERKDIENINLTIEVCNLAVDKIRNPTLLTDVAFNAVFVEVREYSLKYINDEKVLVELAIKDDSLLKTVVNKIHAKSSFVTLAMNLPDDIKYDTGLGNIIIQNINSDKDLLKISKGAKNDNIRALATKNLSSTNNADTFIELAKNDPDSSVRRESVDKITDEKILVDLALNNPDSSVRGKSVEKITDEEILADLALNDSSWGVRLSAVQNKNLKDIKVLSKVANNDPYYQEDPIYESIDSYNVVGTEKYYRIREAAKNRLKEVK